MALRRSGSDAGISEQATISNPRTSQAAKEHSRQVIRELEGQGADSYPTRQPRVDVEEDEGEEEVLVESNPSKGLSDDATHEGVLDDTGPVVGDSSFVGKEPNRVLGGFKATLHSECSLP